MYSFLGLPNGLATVWLHVGISAEYCIGFCLNCLVHLVLGSVAAFKQWVFETVQQSLSNVTIIHGGT